MNRPNVWIIGNRGMLGRELTQHLEQAKVPFVGTDLDISILDLPALEQFGREAFGLSQRGVSSSANTEALLDPQVKGRGQLPIFETRNVEYLSVPSASGRKQPPLQSWIVNCAAYTAVDRAEEELDRCFALNAEGPANIARVAEQLQAGLIHISTDYVFNGTGIQDASGSVRPYREEDAVNPLGVYGRSKAAGEEAVRKHCSRSIILRTAWLYGQYGNNFVHTMLRLMQERESVWVVMDQRGSPTWTADLARVILTILRCASPTFGTFHYTNEGECSWFDFALEIYQKARALSLIGKDCRVEPIPTNQFPTKAKRPSYSVLSKKKIQQEYGLSIPQWQESLERFLKEGAASCPGAS